MEKGRVFADSDISLEKILSFRSSSPEETFELAKNFARRLESGDFVLLSGEIGAGKTIFARGIGEFFNCGRFVHSPSFKIINRYDGDIVLYHLDFFRIRDEREIFDMGVEEIFSEKAVFLIEWPEIFMKNLNRFYFVEFKIDDNDSRSIEIFFALSSKGTED
ncbi:MAG: tRNA (adenosine(37)-N6)-threonylcarbamoyltransferase complex ATPase subunit type 1 TsaE [Elusimicrobia bacterium]|nr:tRNA (adenosine(37)-N6)-threonylcarbamoyltransferase complex ATPase subunit type 1 TsaE [Elusimicrobiota bacterium]